MSRHLLQRYCISIGALLYVFLVSACSVNPVTGQSEFTLISPQQEIAMGEQNYLPSQQSQGGAYVVDPTLTAYVNQVGQRLAKVSDNTSLPYEFVVLNNDVPNAWALPGGKIAVNRGLLIHLDDEAQLAAVLGHEIVHAAARHSAQAMTQNALLGLGVAVLGQVGSGDQAGALIGQGAQIGAAAWQSRYSRGNELEADDYGMVYMSRAGYDPQAAVELQETFVALSRGQRSDFIAGLFASHPPSEERVKTNIKHAKNLSGATRNREAYQQTIAQLKKDTEAYTFQQQAIEAAKNKNYTAGLTSIEQAIRIEPKENHFWETQGRLQASNKDYDGALTSLSKSIALNPNYFRPYIARASVYQYQSKFVQAESDLLASEKLLPTQTASFLLGQVSLSLGKTQQAIEHFRRAAAAGGDVGKAAEAELQKLGVVGQ